ncbi:unnamed protein product [Kuraishia capsulata CBS 1993]|uniref:Uncharacterized protein n=1 Tax=Kuraishia capsulata CBS 1993 TaxID=1382522 RepID=W6MU93_9ASCO|nr:uncharacterized protein KUCA_T00004983001 [Kuraishia capsulata CBS 1993]CDK28997.1 unnamed protein product [Kuraishia capsulata CBS 1993]
MSFTVVTVKITTDDVHKDEYIFYGENLPTPLTEQALLKSLIRNSPEKYRDFLENCELEIKRKSKKCELEIQRKSKKSKRYVSLKTAEDFAALNRSLQVKNCLKLDIVCGKRKEEVSKDVGAAAEFAGAAPSIPPSTAETSASSSTSSAQHTDEPSPGKAKDLPSLIKIFEDLVDDESSSKKFFDHYSKLYEKKGHPSIPEFLASLVNINDLGTVISDNLLNSDFIKNPAKLYSANGIFVDSENDSPVDPGQLQLRFIAGSTVTGVFLLALKMEITSTVSDITVLSARTSISARSVKMMVLLKDHTTIHTRW